MGAQMARRLFMAAHKLTIYLVAVVLPQPGPPVTTHTGERAAVRMASLCPSDSCMASPAQPITHLSNLQLTHTSQLSKDPCTVIDGMQAQYWQALCTAD